MAATEFQAPYDRSSVEAIPFGHLKCNIIGSDLWRDTDRVKRLFTEISNLVKEVVERIPGCFITRIVVVAVQTGREITKWQKELGRPEVITDDAVGVTSGKALVWGSGQLSTSYGIVIISEAIAVEIADRGTDFEMCRALLVHELAHIHDDFIWLQRFGPQKPPSNNDWPGIRRAIAGSIWGEYLAEKVAQSYMKQSQFLNALVLAGQNDFAFSRLSIQNQYNADRNIVPIWAVADELSKIFDNLLGCRTLRLES
jgi:hypothetical protein